MMKQTKRMSIKDLELYKKEITKLVSFSNKNIYKTVQDFILQKTGNTPSVGLICKFFKQTELKEVTPRIGYGKGASTKVGRVEKEYFISSDGVHFTRCKKTSNGWIASYVIAGNGGLYAEDETLCVHHIDHDRSNGSKKNLKLMDSSEHKSYHMKYLWKTQREKMMKRWLNKG